MGKLSDEEMAKLTAIDRDDRFADYSSLPAAYPISSVKPFSSGDAVRISSFSHQP